MPCMHLLVKISLVFGFYSCNFIDIGLISVCVFPKNGISRLAFPYLFMEITNLIVSALRIVSHGPRPQAMWYSITTGAYH